MRFSGMAAELERVFADPNADLMAFNDKIQRIVDAEWDLRYTKKLNRFIKKATLKYATADLLADDYFKTDDILEKRNYFGLLGEFANTSIFDRMGYESNTMSSVFDLFKMGTGTFGGFGI